jgi:cell division protein FtsN
MDKLAIHAGIAGFSKRKDRSYSVRFETGELTTTQAAWLHENTPSWGWLVHVPNDEEAIDNIEVPNTPAAKKDGPSPADRQRRIIYALFKGLQEQGMARGSFESFYETQMERIAEWLKEKIERLSAKGSNGT